MNRNSIAGPVKITGVALLAVVAFCPSRVFAPDTGPAALKANLDLPYDAGGDQEDEEEAPSVIYFYGQQYEGSAIAFALDESGSMNENGRWQIQTREVVRAVQELSERVEFDVVYYSSRVTPFRPTLMNATATQKAAAVQFINLRHPQGDTCLGEGVVKALEIVRRSTTKHRAVIVTSDGHPDNCATGNLATPQEIEIILRQTLAANPDRSVRVHTIWVGQQTEAQAIQFMKRLAEAHGGSFKTANH